MEAGGVEKKVDLVRSIEEALSQVRGFQSQFYQKTPGQKVLKGTFYLWRPGHLKFQYEEPAPFLIVADGRSLIHQDKTTGKVIFFPLTSGPGALLLSPKVSFGALGRIQTVTSDPLYHYVKVHSDQAGEITFKFQRNSLTLQGWSLTDENGATTEVQFFGVRAPKSFPSNFFQFHQKPRWKVKRSHSAPAQG